jgi:hypothetical protein
VELVDAAVGCQHDGAVLVPRADDVVVVAAVGVVERMEAGAIDDEWVESGEGMELAAQAAFSPGSTELAEHAGGVDVAGGESPASGMMSNGLGEVALARAGGADEQNVRVPLDEAKAGEVDEAVSGNARVEHVVGLL